MSDSSDDREGFDFEQALDRVESYYHVVLLAGLAAFMFWNRVRTWDRFTVDGQVVFSGNDAWYHYRQTSYTVENWPQTMPFDPWTYFPYGNASGQFGTLLDQLMATVALVVGLGDPDQQTVAMVVLVMPVVLATLAIVPAYFIGRRLGGRFGGVVAVTVLALTSGEFLRRSLVGFSDHHIAEALFQAVAILAIMVALSVAARDKPIYEQVRARDFDALREPLGWSVLAGIAIALYLWVWPFGAVLLGILGIYFVVQLSLEFLQGQSPEHTAFVGAVSLGTTGVLVLSSTDTLGFVPGEFSMLQPAMAFAVAFGCVFMAWLARTWESRDLPPGAYPLAIVGTIAVGAVVTLVVAPDVVDTIYGNLVRVFGFWIDPSATGRTVGEVQPIRDLGAFYDRYGFAVIIAVAGALWMVTRPVLGGRLKPEHSLMIVWAALMGMAALTQQRFEYYLTVPVAGLAGYVIGDLFRWLDLGFDVDDVEIYQVLSVVAVVLVLVVPMVVGPATAVATAGQNGPGEDIQAWGESLDWMQENTPEEGLYDDDSTDLDFYGTYERTDDFEYEAGSYGVMSWWDYGHWITQRGERIPHANPHQQGADTAANYLLSGSEEEANDVLSDIDESENAQNRYVMVDWKMANSHTSDTFFYQNQQWGNLPNGKFFAPIQFTDRDVGPSDYSQTLYYESESQGFGSFNRHEQAYYESQVTRLYRYHGSAVEPQPVVLEWGPGEFNGQQLPMTYSGQPEEPVLQEFQTMEEARAYAENNTNAQVGGVGALPSERVPALENYRLVSTSETPANEGPGYQLTQASTAVGTSMNNTQLGYLQQNSPQWTKVFERVPGAELEGTAGANATVTVGVEMYNPASNGTFAYTQRTTTDENGDFSLTVPYSTTGYDEWGTEDGRTNVSVRATGEYSVTAIAQDGDSLQAWNGTASVPESAVIGETDEPVTVDLSEIDTTPDETPEGNTSVDGPANETSDDGVTVDGNGTSPNDADANDADTNDTADGQAVTSGPLAEPPAARSVVTP